VLTDIFLVRHAEPARSVGIEYRVMPGPDLSERGRQEAQQAGAFLQGKGLEHLFVSPFARTTQTAELILEHLDIPVTFTRLLEEAAPQERLEQVRERVCEFLQSVLESELTCIGVVTHGAPIGELLRELSNDTLDLHNHSYDVSRNPAPTAGVWHAQRSASSEHGWSLDLVFRPQ
jgi:2,3-bisphosphoglycerate-dependent phosphoglycerate mutase